MDLGSLRALALNLNLEAHGVDITVTLPGARAVEARGIWITTATDDVPSGGEFQRRVPARVIAISRAAVPSLPRGTVIVGPEKAGTDEVAKWWKVDGIDRVESDHTRVVVLEIDESEA
jgi:hypothetical protein